MIFEFSAYDKDSNCKVCKEHVSNLHLDGCEVGAIRKALKRTQEREKFWQEKAGRMARIANWMYQNIKDSDLPDNEVDQAHDYFREIMELIDFDEDLI